MPSSEAGTEFLKAGRCIVLSCTGVERCSGEPLWASDLGPERASPSGGADFEDGFAVRWCLQLRGVAVALDPAGAGIGQCCDDLGFHLGAGARGLLLGLDGARPGGDKAIDGAQRRLVEAGMACAWAAAQRLRYGQMTHCLVTTPSAVTAAALSASKAAAALPSISTKMA